VEPTLELSHVRVDLRGSYLHLKNGIILLVVVDIIGALSYMYHKRP
jgi:hypothetical protein